MPVTPIQRLQKALCARTEGGKPEAVVALARQFGIDGRAGRDAAAGKTVTASDYVRLCGAVGIDPMTGEECAPAALPEIDWNRVGAKLLLALIGEHGKPETAISMRAAAARWKVSLVVLGRVKAGSAASADNFLKLCAGLKAHPLTLLRFVPQDVSQKHAPEHVDLSQAELGGAR